MQNVTLNPGGLIGALVGMLLGAGLGLYLCGGQLEGAADTIAKLCFGGLFPGVVLGNAVWGGATQAPEVSLEAAPEDSNEPSP